MAQQIMIEVATSLKTHSLTFSILCAHKCVHTFWNVQTIQQKSIDFSTVNVNNLNEEKKRPRRRRRRSERNTYRSDESQDTTYYGRVFKCLYERKYSVAHALKVDSISSTSTRLFNIFNEWISHNNSFSFELTIIIIIIILVECYHNC